VDANNERQQPIMIHRALLGSLERFFGILVENYAGGRAPVCMAVWRPHGCST
jgi:threonyl-tRNA synthetase